MLWLVAGLVKFRCGWKGVMENMVEEEEGSKDHDLDILNVGNGSWK